MTPHYSDDWLTIYGGDCREVLAALPSDSVDCVVTSPPYWGLRDYGTATWTDGGAECDHKGPPMRTNNKPSDPSATFHGGSNRSTEPWKDGTCGKCGATRIDSQLGLERTPEEYVANMVAVFREVRRALKPSGTCWLNLGDSYASTPPGNPGAMQARNGAGWQGEPRLAQGGHGRRSTVVSGLKPKDLVGIPWRVAFALQADGWYLRSDIIWSKPNPMPESVTDRPTKSHEYLFLLTKSARYYFDADAVREGWADERNGAPGGHKSAVRNRGGRTDGFTSPPQDWTAPDGRAGRNIRSVWNIATRPYPGAHFAVFPPDLPERCIKAGSPERGTVMDPFAGSGTVGMVANRLSRRAILIDLNPEYLRQQMTRNAQTPLGLGA